MANSSIAYRSSISIGGISKSISNLSSSVANTQKTAIKMTSVLSNSNRRKSTQLSRITTIFQKRQEAVRRREQEDIVEASSISAPLKRSGSIISSSTKGFLGRIFDFVGTLMVGWLINNLPSIISSSQALSTRVKKLTAILSFGISDMRNILVGFGGVLRGIYSNIVRFDFTDSEKRVSTSFNTMNDGLEEVRIAVFNVINLFSGDLNKLFGFDIPKIDVPEIPVPDTDLDTGTRGTPGTGGRLQPIHKQALDIIARPESGAAGYNAMNQGTDKNGNIIGSTVGGKTSKDIIGKNLTDMTIGEVMDRQDESKYPRGARPDRGIHAAGRYQIIGSTMISAVKLAGLSRSDKFDEANQDLLGIAVLKSQGIGAWTVGGSRYTAAETAIVNKAKNTPFGQPTATVQPGTKYAKNQNITSIVGAKGTPAVVVSSLRGMRTLNGVTRWHGGIDIATDGGTYIALRANCVVLYAGTRGGYGLMVDVWVESENIKLRMAHCSSILPNCKVGAVIPAGVSFARVGSTGESTGPHIHFEADTNKQGTMTNGRDYGGNTSPDSYVPLLLLTSRQSNGFKGVTSANGKPLAKASSLGTGGGSEIIESLTPERRGQTVIVSQQQAQQAPQMPMSTKSEGMTSLPDNSLNTLRNNILLTHLAYT
jgi:murein DD-endopeptidase MepM/ murein hydrolase activator NlpD